MTRLRILLALALGLAPAGDAPAADSGLDRLTLRQDLLGWEAVGRLDLDARGFCTGALVAPDLVLTAAHCLIDDAGARVPPERVMFRAGWRDGVAVAERSGTRAVLHPAYDPADGDALRQLAADLALLQLAEPIPAALAAPFVPAAPSRSGAGVSLVSYARGRADAPSWQRRCTVTGRGSGALLMTCLADFGASGAPVFETGSGRPRIVSVISRGARTAQGSEVLGPELARAFGSLKAALREGRGVWPAPDFAARRIAPEDAEADLPVVGARPETGARFLRP